MICNSIVPRIIYNNKIAPIILGAIYLFCLFGSLLPGEQAFKVSFLVFNHIPAHIDGYAVNLASELNW